MNGMLKWVWKSREAQEAWMSLVVGVLLNCPPSIAHKAL